ncbi:MAG: acyl-protein synthetase [Elusimicrobia bacterium]|nr:acyl-protein synthetase [Elusimicrobiota bacterium]
MSFPNARAVCGVADPHVWTPEKSRLMVAACRELAAFHARRSPELAALYRRRGFRPDSIRGEADLRRIPMLCVSAMKSFLLTSLPRRRAVLRLTSSGTRGQKTQIWFDRASLARCQAQLAGLWKQEGLLSRRPTNYLMFVYDPKEAKDLGIAFSDTNQQRFAPAARVFYAVRKGASGGWEFRREQALAALESFAAEGRPARLFGIPSFIHEFVEWLPRAVRLPPGSWMVTGGGWKAAEDKQVSREEFRARAAARLGLAPENIRDGYGMAEHCAPYLECRRHRFHVPAYNRVFARHPVTLEALPPGRPGLLELVTPWNAMMPNLAILSTDLGRIEAGRCPCGYNSPTFTLLGRGGLAKHKGCALHAAEIVRRQP